MPDPEAPTTAVAAPPVKSPIEAEKPSFLAMFGSLEDGALDSDLTDDLVQLVHDMRAFALATGAKPRAKMTLSLEIKLDGGIFEVIPSYTVKPPKKPRSRSIFYATKSGGLSANNPSQTSLPLGPPKDVTATDRPIAVVR
ncbi:MAG: hypothetical protein U9Q74_08970 [Gemmatimonadota bacterium]|nr:hypothetical protein [Gemmatimonadota bacterium]